MLASVDDFVHRMTDTTFELAVTFRSGCIILNKVTHQNIIIVTRSESESKVLPQFAVESKCMYT